MRRKWGDIPEEEIRKAVKTSSTKNQCVDKLGFVPSAGNNIQLLAYSKRYDINTAHFPVAAKIANSTFDEINAAITGATSFTQALQHLHTKKVSTKHIEQFKSRALELGIDITHLRSRWKEVPLEELKQATATSKNIDECCKKLGFKRQKTHIFSALMLQHDLDISHFTRKKPFEEMSSDAGRRKRLIEERGHSCEECKEDEWRGKYIPIEMHHLDENRTNNTKSNLKLLCANCHSHIHNRGK